MEYKIYNFLKLKVKFENGIKLEISVKDFNEEIKEEKIEDIIKKDIIKDRELSNFLTYLNNFLTYLKENYGVKEITGCKTQKIDDYHYISIVLYPESEKKKEDGTLKIFDRSSIRLAETSSYDLIAEYNEKENKKENEQLEIILSEEKISKNFVSYFSNKKNCCTINFQGHTFFGNIIIKGKNVSARIPVLVYPIKIKPEEAEKILNELLMEQEEIIKSSPTGVFLNPGEKIRKTPLQTLILINYLFSENRKNRIPLGKTLQAIAQSPDKMIVKEKVKRRIHEITTIDEEAILEGIISGNIKKTKNHQFLWNNQGYSFTLLLNEEARISYDTYSNRFIKYFLEFLRNTINICCERVQKEHEKVREDFIENLINRVQFYKVKYLLPLLNLEWMSEVSRITHLPPPPQKLLKDPFYSSAFFDYLDLIKNLKIVDEEFEKYLYNPITYMPELYEKWCGLKLKRIADKIGAEFEYQPSYKNKKEGDNWYSYSVNLKPDFSLSKNDKLILFDAKYRVDFVEEFKELGDEKLDEIRKEEKRGTFKLGDLYKMHTYKDAIRKRNEKPLWVIALYPGDKIFLYTENGEEIKSELKEGKFEEIKEKINNLKSGGVGAIAFKPEFFENEENKNFLYDLIKYLCQSQ